MNPSEKSHSKRFLELQALKEAALEIPVTRVAEDLGFEYDRRERRYRKDGYQVVIASDRDWRKGPREKAFKSFGSGPELSGKGAIDFVMKYLGYGFVEAVTYLAGAYGLVAGPVAPVSRTYSPGLRRIDGWCVYPRGGERPKRILVLADAEWLSAGAIAVAGTFPEARTQWRQLGKPRTDIFEYTDERTIVTVLPVLDGAGPKFCLNAARLELLAGELGIRAAREQGSIHLADADWWADVEIEGDPVEAAAESMARRCPVYLYRTVRPRMVSPPPVHENCWREVREYLTRKRGIDESIVDDCRRRNYLFGTKGWMREEKYLHIGCGAVFVTRTPAGVACGAVIRVTRENAFIPKRTMDGMDRESGFFWRFLRGETPAVRPTMYVTEAPIEALSVETLARRLGVRLSNTLLVAKSGEGGDRPIQIRMGKVLAAGGSIIVGFNSDPKGAGMAMMQKLTAPFATEVDEGRVILQMPESRKDWNEVLMKRIGERR